MSHSSDIEEEGPQIPKPPKGAPPPKPTRGSMAPSSRDALLGQIHRFNKDKLKEAKSSESDNSKEPGSRTLKESLLGALNQFNLPLEEHNSESPDEEWEDDLDLNPPTFTPPKHVPPQKPANKGPSKQKVTSDPPEPQNYTPQRVFINPSDITKRRRVLSTSMDSDMSDSFTDSFETDTQPPLPEDTALEDPSPVAQESPLETNTTVPPVTSMQEEHNEAAKPPSDPKLDAFPEVFELPPLQIPDPQEEMAQNPVEDPPSPDPQKVNEEAPPSFDTDNAPQAAQPSTENAPTSPPEHSAVKTASGPDNMAPTPKSFANEGPTSPADPNTVSQATQSQWQPATPKSTTPKSTESNWKRATPQKASLESLSSSTDPAPSRRSNRLTTFVAQNIKNRLRKSSDSPPDLKSAQIPISGHRNPPLFVQQTDDFKSKFNTSKGFETDNPLKKYHHSRLKEYVGDTKTFQRQSPEVQDALKAFQTLVEVSAEFQKGTRWYDIHHFNKAIEKMNALTGDFRTLELNSSDPDLKQGFQQLVQDIEQFRTRANVYDNKPAVSIAEQRDLPDPLELPDPELQNAPANEPPLNEGPSDTLPVYSIGSDTYDLPSEEELAKMIDETADLIEELNEDIEQLSENTEVTEPLSHPSPQPPSKKGFFAKMVQVVLDTLLPNRASAKSSSPSQTSNTQDQPPPSIRSQRAQTDPGPSREALMNDLKSSLSKLKSADPPTKPRRDSSPLPVTHSLEQKKKQASLTKAASNAPSPPQKDKKVKPQ